MGVLMQGVNVPKNCEECNFKGECRDYWVNIREAYTRPSWCPLVEVADRKTEPLTCRNKDHYADCEYKDNCNPVVCFKALDEFREMVTKSQKERSGE